MIEPLVVWAALGSLALFTAGLLKRYLDHLESDISYSRKTSERGVEVSEKATEVAVQKVAD